MPSSKKGQTVEVRWIDVIHDSSWDTADSIECPIITTVGYFVSESETTLKIGSTMSSDGEISGICAFPLGCVMKVREVTKHEYPIES
tara:strand:+ start:1351 stop:1611 length:261 start_codon:yes stop_codon:yes gene_type:complete